MWRACQSGRGGTTVRWVSDSATGMRGQGARPGGAYDRGGEAARRGGDGRVMVQGDVCVVRRHAGEERERGHVLV
jgi:hypothetical protein